MLQSNNFSGSFSSNDFTSCTNLLTLNMSYNSLTGSFPSDLFLPMMDSIRALDLKFNKKLSGNFAALNYSFPKLDEVDLNSNYFTGSLPSEVFRSPMLKLFNVSTNLLTGSIPETISSARSLQQFYIGTNIGISGAVTPNMWGPYLPKTLIALDFQATSIKGNLSSVVPLVSVQNLNTRATEFTGSIPEELCQMKDLITFVIATNAITGPIPKKILSYPGNGIPNNGSCLKNMTYFVTFHTNLEGTLPLDLSPMPKLNVFSIGSCNFDGPLPKVWPRSISKIVMHSNFFTGHIGPDQFSSLPSLFQLSISSNALTGTWEKATNVTWECAKGLLYFQIHANLFHGPIFPLVVQFPNLRVLTLGNNSFTGNVMTPETSEAVRCPWCSMTMMFLRLNQFDGALPPYLFTSQPFVNDSNSEGSVITYHSAMSIFFIDDNYFSGQISPFVHESNTSVFLCSNVAEHPNIQVRLNVSSITAFRVAANLFSGLAESFFYLPIVDTLIFDSNSFSGTLPNVLFSEVLEDFSAAYNQFTGDLPSVILQKPKLSIVLVNSNKFIGDIYKVISSAPLLKSLDTIDLSENNLSGFIPWELLRDRMPRLRVFAAATNCISSPLTSDICSNSSNLEELVLDGLRSATTCRQSLLLNSHSFILKAPEPAGPIPSCLFSLPKIQVLHLAGNLMYGTLPNDAMILSGAVNVSSALTTLVVSNNVLSGTIPFWIQHRMWGTLVLSNNRLTGELSDDFNVFTVQSGTIRLDVNRLSGFVPDVMIPATDISILSGNLFDCNEMTRSDLPDNDPSYDSYSCGSAPTNNAMSTWASIVGAMVATFLISYLLIRKSLISRWEQSAGKEVDPANFSTGCLLLIENFWRNWVVWFFPTYYDDAVLMDINVNTPEIEDRDTLSSSRDMDSTVTRSSSITSSNVSIVLQGIDGILRLSSLYRNTRVLIMMLTALLVFIFTPIFAGLSLHSHTLYDKYIWTISGIYLSGVAAAVVMLFMFASLLLLSWTWIILVRRLSGLRQKSQSLPQLWYTGYMIGNVIANIGIDVAYVLVVIHSSSTAAFGFAILQAICKTILNIVMIEWWFLRLKRKNAARIAAMSNEKSFTQENPIISQNPNRPKVNMSSSNDAEYVYNIENVRKLVLNTHDYSIIIVTFLVNSIWIPFLSSVWVSPNCFSNILQTTPTYDGSYTIQESLSASFSDDLDLPRTLTSVHTVTYDAPFVYSFNCASTIVSYFVPTYVFQSIIQTCIIPIIHLLLYRIFVSLRQQGWEATLVASSSPSSSSAASAASASSVENGIVDEPSTSAKIAVSSKTRIMDFIFNVLPSRYRFLIAIDDESTLIRLMKRYFSKDGHAAHKKDSFSSVIFLTDRFLPAKVYHFLALILCFGAIFPLLAIPVCIASIVMTWMEERLVYRVWGWSQNVKSMKKTAVRQSEIAARQHDSATEALWRQQHEVLNAKVALAAYIQQNLEIELKASQFFFSHPRLIFFVLTIISPILSFLVYDTAGDEHTNWVNGVAVALPLLFFPLILFLIRKYFVRQVGLLPTVIKMEEKTVAAFEMTVTAFRERSGSTALDVRGSKPHQRGSKVSLMDYRMSRPSSTRMSNRLSKASTCDGES
jgi:hypothetical protein